MILDAQNLHTFSQSREIPGWQAQKRQFWMPFCFLLMGSQFRVMCDSPSLAASVAQFGRESAQYAVCRGFEYCRRHFFKKTTVLSELHCVVRYIVLLWWSHGLIYFRIGRLRDSPIMLSRFIFRPISALHTCRTQLLQHRFVLCSSLLFLIAFLLIMLTVALSFRPISASISICHHFPLSASFGTYTGSFSPAS